MGRRVRCQKRYGTGLTPVLTAPARSFSFCHTFNNMCQNFLSNVVLGRLFRWVIVYPVILLSRVVPTNAQLCGLPGPIMRIRFPYCHDFETQMDIVSLRCLV